jgi:ABC-type iron transport system FetAB permease component
MAAEHMAIASPAAVAKLTSLIRSDKDEIALRAALGLLDRAGVETARKSETKVSLAPEIEDMIAKVYGGDEEGADGDGDEGDDGDEDADA